MKQLQMSELQVMYYHNN